MGKGGLVGCLGRLRVMKLYPWNQWITGTALPFLLSLLSPAQSVAACARSRSRFTSRAAVILLVLTLQLALDLLAASGRRCRLVCRMCRARHRHHIAADLIG